MYLQKVISKKIWKKKVTDKNSREVWIRGSGSVPKFHGSATLHNKNKFYKTYRHTYGQLANAL